MSKNLFKPVFLPPLPFGEADATIESDIDVFRDRMATVIKSIQSYEACHHATDFQYKSSVLTINGMKLVASVNTDVDVVVNDTHDTTLMIPFYGQNLSSLGKKNMHWRADDSAMFFPGMGRRGASSTRASLMVDLDPLRLQAMARSMLGLPAYSPMDLRLQDERTLALHQNGVAFDAVFRHLCSLIDAYRYQPQALAMLGIDELFYRNIVMMLRPDLFMGAQLPAAQPSTHKAIDIACQYITTHLAERITLSDLEQASGMSARTLQYAFLQHFQCTPMQWVRQQRLQYARECLQKAHCGDSVARIACACGFSNQGVFAAFYLQRFGELPSQTLAQAVRFK